MKMLFSSIKKVVVVLGCVVLASALFVAFLKRRPLTNRLWPKKNENGKS